MKKFIKLDTAVSIALGMVLYYLVQTFVFPMIFKPKA